jgi:hypothetical protein
VKTGADMTEPTVELVSTSLVNAKTTSNLYTQDSNATLTTIADQKLDSSAKFSCYTFQNSDASKQDINAADSKGWRQDNNKDIYSKRTPNGTSYDEVVKAGYVYKVTVNLTVNRISKEFDVTLHYEAVPLDQVTVNVPSFD